MFGVYFFTLLIKKQKLLPEPPWMELSWDADVITPPDGTVSHVNTGITNSDGDSYPWVYTKYDDILWEKYRVIS